MDGKKTIIVLCLMLTITTFRRILFGRLPAVLIYFKLRLVAPGTTKELTAIFLLLFKNFYKFTPSPPFQNFTTARSF